MVESSSILTAIFTQQLMHKLEKVERCENMVGMGKCITNNETGVLIRND